MFILAPGRNAPQNFFTYNFGFSFLHTAQSVKEKSHNNQAVKPKKKLNYGNPLRLAREWQKGLETGRCASQAAIAREHGISRARVTQLMNLLKNFPNGKPQRDC